MKECGRQADPERELNPKPIVKEWVSDTSVPSPDSSLKQILAQEWVAGGGQRAVTFDLDLGSLNSKCDYDLNKSICLSKIL